MIRKSTRLAGKQQQQQQQQEKEEAAAVATAKQKEQKQEQQQQQASKPPAPAPKAPLSTKPPAAAKNKAAAPKPPAAAKPAVATKPPPGKNKAAAVPKPAAPKPPAAATTAPAVSLLPPPTFSFKKPGAATHAPAPVKSSSGGVPAPAPAPATKRQRAKSVKAKEAEDEDEDEDEEQAFDNDAGLDEAGLGPNQDIDVWCSFLGAEADGGAEYDDDDDAPTDDGLYLAQIATLVRAYAGGPPLPHFADTTLTHQPVLSSGKEAVADWNDEGPGGVSFAPLRFLASSVIGHEAGGEVNYAVVSAMGGGRGRVEEAGGVSASSHLAPGSAAYLVALADKKKGARGVALTLELAGEEQPVRLFLPSGCLVRVGIATLGAVTRQRVALLPKPEAQGKEAEAEAVVVAFYNTARLRDLSTGSIVVRAAAGLGQTGAKKRKAPSAAPGKKEKGKGKKTVKEEEGEQDSDKENEAAAVAAAAEEEEESEAVELLPKPKKQKKAKAAAVKPKAAAATKATKGKGKGKGEAGRRKALGDVTNAKK